MPTGRRLREMMNRCVVRIDGWGAPAGEILMVPEIPRFYSRLHDAWPYWLYFCNQDRDALGAITERIRTALKSAGALSGDEQDFRVFDSLSWTDAQKRNARQYRPGMVLRFHQAKDGFERGETVEVVTAGDALTVRRKSGLVRLVNPDGLAKFLDAGESRTLKIAAGDKLLLQANAVAAGQHFINGELVQVKAIQGGDSPLVAPQSAL